MGRKREMVQHNALVRLRAGDTEREIARSGLIGHDKLDKLRALGQSCGWLTAGAELADDVAIATAMAPWRRAASTISCVKPLREVVQHWSDARVQGVPSTQP